MNVKVTLEFPNAVEAAAFLADFDGGAVDTGAAVAGAETGKRGRGRPRAAETAAPAAAAAPAANQPAAAQAATTAAAVPFKSVADPISELAEIDHPKAVAVLAQFGVKKASDLKPDQYGAVAQAANAALLEAKKPAAGTGLI